MKTASHTFLNMQVLRGIAASMVVFHHSLHQIDGLPDCAGCQKIGYLGVDIFFVISGFVIALTASRAGSDWRGFLANRLVRVVPLYWFFTLLLVTGLLLAPQLFKSAVVTPLTLAQSLLFVPHFSLSFPSEIWPILVPGWSLNYEMFFYLATALGLSLFPGRVLTFLAPMLLALVALGTMIKPQSPELLTYTDPKLLEFLGGAVIARAWLLGYLDGRLGLAFAIPLGAALLALAVVAPASWSSSPWNPIAATILIVLGLVALETAGYAAGGRLWLLIGDASYSIYLSHVFTLGIARTVWGKLGLASGSALASLGYYAVAIVASILAGIVIYWLIEQPLLRLGRSRLQPRRVEIA